MKVNAFALTAASAPLIIAGAAQAGIVGLTTRFVDPTTQIGANGSWAANGYVGLDTYRVYAQFNANDSVLAVGDLFIGGTVFNLSTDAPTFFNSIGAFGNNGLQKPGDFTPIPGPMGYTSQWDSYLTIDALGSVSLAPGLTTALGATAMGMGGLVGNSFAIDNTGWSTTPGAPNTVFNGATGFWEAPILQLTVADGFDVWGDDIIITTSTANTGPFHFHSTPAPGALALLGLAGLTGMSRRRRS
jgi:MYXO-CTERM domain-containing protein